MSILSIFGTKTEKFHKIWLNEIGILVLRCPTVSYEVLRCLRASYGVLRQVVTSVTHDGCHSFEFQYYYIYLRLVFDKSTLCLNPII